MTRTMKREERMDYYEVIRTRHSVRQYESRGVEEERLKRILEAARAAPSASNLQPYKLVVVKDPDLRARLAREGTTESFIGGAPVIVVAVSLRPDHIMSGGVPSHPVDLAIALDHMSLAAVAEGLGTCWIGAFHQEVVKRILGIPGKYRVVALMPVGYPAKVPSSRRRKPLEQLVCYDSFKE